MVFPDSNPKESRFLIVWNVYDSEYFEWVFSLKELKNKKQSIESDGNDVSFAGEIAILKDLTNIEK
jgi:hypothetical protein